MRSWTWVKNKKKIRHRKRNGNREERKCDDRNVTETWSFAFRRGSAAGVRIVECGAEEESEKKSEGGKEGEGESKERLWDLFSKGHSAHFVDQ